MANSSRGRAPTTTMQRCLDEAKLGSLARGEQGYWCRADIVPGSWERWQDITIHALIACGRLIVIDREKNSRMPTAVRLASDEERV